MYNLGNVIYSIYNVELAGTVNQAITREKYPGERKVSGLLCYLYSHQNARH